MKVSFDTDAKRAKEDTRAWAALALTAEEKVSVEDPLGMEKLADALPLDRAASRWGSWPLGASRLTIAKNGAASTGLSGQPSAARRWFSNWLARQASME